MAEATCAGRFTQPVTCEELRHHIHSRLRTDAKIPKVSVPGGDFLDVAQGLERQELARISASRLTERAQRLRDVLMRVSAGEYGVCAGCGTAIPTQRLLAVPDATTCVACQAQLERGATSRGVRHRAGREPARFDPTPP